jgi:hypothetical protein
VRAPHNVIEKQNFLKMTMGVLRISTTRGRQFKITLEEGRVYVGGSMTAIGRLLGPLLWQYLSSCVVCCAETSQTLIRMPYLYSLQKLQI